MKINIYYIQKAMALSPNLLYMTQKQINQNLDYLIQWMEHFEKIKDAPLITLGTSGFHYEPEKYFPYININD